MNPSGPLNPANPFSPLNPLNPASPLYQSTVGTTETASCTTQECQDMAVVALSAGAIVMFLFVIALLLTIR